MDQNEIGNLDVEFKRYIQILRSYLQQIVDKNIPDICDAWIKRLSSSEDDEKPLRNKYIFTLCYQLARGSLDDPFLTCPPTEKLKPFSENDSLTEDSSTDLECVVVDFDGKSAENNEDHHSDTDQLSQEGTLSCRKDSCEITNCERNEDCQNDKILKQSFVTYDCPLMRSDEHESTTTHYEYRATNLITKLREIKKQNILLHDELRALKEEAKMKPQIEDDSIKINNNSFVRDESLKWKLKEMQESRTNLIEAISTLQDNLEHFDDLKQQEIEDIKAKHQLEIIKIKSAVREEMKELHDKNLEGVKEKYEQEVLKVKTNTEKEICEVISSKDKIIIEKDNQIQRLQTQVDELRNNLQSTLNRLLEKSTGETNSDNDFFKLKAQQLERKLERVEKIKQKCSRVYEAKIAILQREKHLTECSLQLQLVRQRAQVVNDTAAENQTELNNALDKLETKYKDIVANIQATAIQRRIQDQMALESILQTASSLAQSENAFQANYLPATNYSRFPKTARNQNIETNQSYDTEISSLLRGGKDCNPVGCAGNKSLGEESVMAGYCLDSERMGELFERVYIPQRDTGDGPPK